MEHTMQQNTGRWQHRLTDKIQGSFVLRTQRKLI